MPAGADIYVAGQLGPFCPQRTTIVDIAGSIVGAAQNIRIQKDASLALSARVNDVLAIVTGVNNDCLDGPESWKHALDNLRTILIGIERALQGFTAQSYLSQVLRRERNTTELKRLSERLGQELESLKIQASLNGSILLDSMTNRVESSTTLKEIEAVYRATALAISARGDAASTSGSFLEGSDTNVNFQPRPPPSPSFLFGRASDAQLVADAITASGRTGHVAILGGPGMGKTTLALSILHDPRVVARFGHRRYFVSCEAADTQHNCLNLIASSLGIAGPEISHIKQQLDTFFCHGPCLLLLDNFESVWEADSRRLDAEAALQHLASVDGLSIVLTVRGSERPQGVLWTRPLLPPLEPLPDAAAAQLFASICDAPPAEQLLAEMLVMLDNVPLAVVLTANLAQYDPIDQLLTRLRTEKTSLLTRKDGTHATRLTSVDVSISLSLYSPRMQLVPDAAVLLGLLSLLPRGAPATDITLWFPGSGKALSTLLQTALAYRSSQGRIQVLAPIRAFVQVHCPPPAASITPLYSHYFELAEQLKASKNMHWNPSTIADASTELVNITALISHALEYNDDPRAALGATVCICSFYDSMGLGPVELLPAALSVARSDARFHDLAADLLLQNGIMAWNMSVSGDPMELWAEARDLYEASGNLGGAIKARLELASCLGEAGLEETAQLRKLAESLQDMRLVGLCDYQIAQIGLSVGKPDVASAALLSAARALRSCEQLDVILYGHVLCQTAAVDARLGRNARGQHAMLREALQMYQEFGLTGCVGEVKERLGATLVEEGDAEGAIPLLRSAAEFYRSSSYWEGPMCHCKLSTACLAADDLEGATEAIEIASQSSVGRSGDRGSYLRAMIFCARGELALWSGDTVEAATALAVAESTLRELQTSGGNTLPIDHVLSLEAEIQVMQGKIALEIGDMDESRRRLIVAVAVAYTMESGPDTMRVLGLLAQATEDDDTADTLSQSTMLPAMRMGRIPDLAQALLHSATVARRRGDVPTARHRARNSLRYFEQTKNRRGCAKARSFLETLGAINGTGAA